MADDEPTHPGRRKRSHWGDDERDSIGKLHRRRTSPYGLPLVAPTHGEVEELADAEDSDGTPRAVDDLPADAELSQPSEMVMADPVAMEIWGHIERVARRSVRRHRDTGDRIAEVHADAGNQHLGKRVADIEKLIKWIKGGILTALVGVAASLITVGKGVFASGERTGRDEIRLEQVEHAFEQLRTDYRDLRRALDDRGRRYFDTSPSGASWSFPAPAPAASTIGPPSPGTKGKP